MSGCLAREGGSSGGQFCTAVEREIECFTMFDRKKEMYVGEMWDLSLDHFVARAELYYFVQMVFEGFFWGGEEEACGALT